MLELFLEKVMDFMISPSIEKKKEIKKLYKKIQDSKDIAEDRLKSVKEVFSYVDWVLSE